MATTQLTRVIETIREVVLRQDERGLTDGQLLESYIRCREEAAFAALVRRHGSMVWGVCRRVLRSHQDAEDAFQATFLVLVRKAAAVVSKELVANWLYGVAHQTALKARAAAAKRSVREKQVTAMPEPALEPHELWDDMRSLLDQELSRLPDKYRAVIVLLDLEGKTRKEAARHLHVPEGTVASRLATARAMLAKRLSRHGPRITGAALATALAANAASAGVPLKVASATIKAASLYAAGSAAAGGVTSVTAVALAEGVLKTMLLTKVKCVATVLMTVAMFGAGAAALTQPMPAEKSAVVVGGEQSRPEARAQPPANQSTKGKSEPAKEINDRVGQPTVVTGVVKAVDADRNTLTLTLALREGEATFSVAKDAHIGIDGKQGTLAGLPAGANVHLSQFLDQKTTRSISAGGSSVFASVKTVDAANSTITVVGQPDDRTFAVATDTIITIDGKPGTLADIPKGASLHALNLRVDQKTAHSINVEGPSLHHVAVKAVDAERNTIIFDDKAPAELAAKAVAVARDADIRIDGQPGKLSGVPAGAFVNLVLTVDLQTARRLDVEGPNLGGCGGSMVKAVDARNYSITYDDRALGEVAGKTFTIAKDAHILIDGRSGTLAGLPAGSYVNVVLTVDQSRVRQLHAQGAPATGTLKAVDASKNTAAVDDTIYSVAKDAYVVLDGNRGDLAALKAGITVNLVLSVDQRRSAASTRKRGEIWRSEDALRSEIPNRGQTAMKHFFLATLLLGPCGSVAFAQWQTQTVGTKADFRGLGVVSSNVAWVSGTNGTFARTTDGGKSWSVGTVPGAEKLDFRDVEAFGEAIAYLLSAGPGDASRIYKTVDGGKSWAMQFKSADPAAFFDAIAFWDEQNGIALGDPVNGLFQLIVTADGGANWKPVTAKSLPQALPGEGAFAASGTCLLTHGESDVWFATGGAKTARVFHSKDRGQSWEVCETPISAGVESAGVFSIAFRDKQHGMIVGGNYRSPNEIGATAATTSDGGKTWHLLDKRLPFRSGVTWAKDRWIAVGTSGSNVSVDNGATWKLLDRENYNSVGFTSTGEGWAVGPKGRIAKFVK